MSLIIKNEGNICLESKQTIRLDPKENVASTAEDIYLFTHLSTDLLQILADKRRKNLVYLPQMLLKQLQKLVQAGFIRPLNFRKIKCYPYNYPVQIADLWVTAFPSDDGLNGAVSLLLEHEGKALGYTGRFITRGAHKKRIKKWKKAFQTAKLDLLLLDSAALQTSEVFVSNTKKFKRFLANLSTTDLPALKLSELAPEEILEYQEIAKQAGRTLLLAPDLAILAKLLFPFDDFTAATPTTLKLAVEKPEKFIIQAGIAKQDTIIYNKDSIKDIDVIAADQSESELKEVVHVIAPTQCLSYGEKTLEAIEPLTKTVSFSEERV